MEIINNPQLQLAFDFVQYTSRNIFLTGKAGTGKTTFLHHIKQNSPKRMIVVAPTGVAAINAGGVTIHSFFQMPFGPHIPSQDQPKEKKEPFNKRFSKEKIGIMKSLDLLIIDEISMVRADLLDGIDEVLRRFKGKNLPFGGVQLLMIGDLQQLAPVVKDDEWDLLRNYYDSIYFFSSHALRQTQHISIELKHIYRQKDADFIQILNNIRDNNLDAATLQSLNKRYIPDFLKTHKEGYITLTTHNSQAHQINEKKLHELNSKDFVSEAVVSGDFPEYSYPTEYKLTLKKGAQVMFVKNDSSREKLYYNGKIGKIEAIDPEEEIIYVRCAGNEDDIAVSRVEWQNSKYTLNEESKEIEESVAGTFTQYPLKLAWAITIHKSQGLTFEKAVIDANAAFAHGQVYVALSRCKTLDGLVLSSPIETRSIKSDSTVLHFMQDAEKNCPGEQQLSEAKYLYQQTLLRELFDFSTLRTRFSYCLKILKDNPGSIHALLSDAFTRMNDLLNVRIVTVAEKFQKQELLPMIMQQQNPEENKMLQDRIRKACVYFYENTERDIHLVLSDLDIDVDNKTVKKTLQDAVAKLREEIAIKTACLKSAQEGFSVKKYLNARAKASISELDSKQKNKKVQQPVSDSIDHPELYNLLKQWRKAKAEEMKVPVYFILPQNALMNLLSVLPQSLNELKGIHGFGKKKINSFGAELIEIISDYITKSTVDS